MTTSDVETAAERRAREKRARSFVWQTVQRFKRWRSSRARSAWARSQGMPSGMIGRGSKGR